MPHTTPRAAATCWTFTSGTNEKSEGFCTGSEKQVNVRSCRIAQTPSVKPVSSTNEPGGTLQPPDTPMRASPQQIIAPCGSIAQVP
jgi:hypothetical protein